MKWYLIILIGVIMMQQVSADIAVPSCNYTLAVANTRYYLTGNIVTNVTCLTINASDVLLDCQGNSIIYGNASNTLSYYGIFTGGVITNITNCIIMNGNASKVTLTRAGIYNSNGYLHVFNSSFINNQGAIRMSARGGTVDNVTIINSTSSATNWPALFMQGGVISNVYIQNTFRDSIWLSTGGNATVTNFTGINCSNSPNYACIRLYRQNNATFKNIYINGTNNKGNGIRLQIDNNAFNTSNNYFENVYIGNTSGDAVVIYRTLGSSVNNTFFNATYDINKENLSLLNTRLIRIWKYTAFVNDSLDNPVSNANIVVINKSGVNMFNLTTDESGYNSSGNAIIDYVNQGGTRTWFSPYTIYALNDSYFPIPFIFNTTSMQNTRHDMTTRVNCWIKSGSILFVPKSWCHYNINVGSFYI